MSSPNLCVHNVGWAIIRLVFVHSYGNAIGYTGVDVAIQIKKEGVELV